MDRSVNGTSPQSHPTPTVVAELANTLGFHVALRRLVSLDHQLGLNRLPDIQFPPPVSGLLRLDPTDERTDGPVDPHAAIQWPSPIEELLEVVQR